MWAKVNSVRFCLVKELMKSRTMRRHFVFVVLFLFLLDWLLKYLFFKKITVWQTFYVIFVEVYNMFLSLQTLTQ